jgi:hypothetical protein
MVGKNGVWIEEQNYRKGKKRDGRLKWDPITLEEQLGR